jgi:hypothetical protein
MSSFAKLILFMQTQPPTSKNSATNNVRKFKTALREKDRIEIAARNAGLEQRGVQSSTTVHVPVGAGSPPDRKRRLSYEEEDDRRAPKLARNEFLYVQFREISEE